jgi:hypothetical protein
MHPEGGTGMAVLSPLSLAADVRVGVDVCAERRTQLHLLIFEAEAWLGRALLTYPTIWSLHARPGSF